MRERIDHTELVQVVASEGSPQDVPAGTVLAWAACRYICAADGWHGMLSDIRPARVLAPGRYELVFADGRRARIMLTAFSPRDLRRAYYIGEGAAPASTSTG